MLVNSSPGDESSASISPTMTTASQLTHDKLVLESPFDSVKKRSAEGSSVGPAASFEEDEPARPWYRFYRSKLWSICSFILVVELCERLCYYTFAGSQRNFLMHLGYSASEATSLNAAFSILCYLFPILGGWMADAFLGRYKTILLFASIYVVGVFLAAGSAYPTFDNEIMYLIAVFGLVAIGTGGIKPNISNFGADQYDVTIPREAREQETFFSYFYWMINIGAAVAYGYLVTLATSGSGAIPQEYGFFAAFMIAACCMCIAYVVFLLGTPRYTRKPPGGDSLRGLCYYLWQSAKSSRKGALAFSGWIVLVLFILLSIVQAFVTDSTAQDAMSYTALGLALYSCAVLCLCHMNNDHLDGLPESPDAFLVVVEAKDLLDIVPIVLVVNIGFMIVYNCMNGPMQSQACQMDVMVGSGQINGALFNIGDCFAIIIMIPLFENIVFPLIEKYKGSKITLTSKLISGLIIAALGALVAAGLEYARRAAPVTEYISDCAPPGIYMSDISGFLMFIPFFLIGTGEVLVNPCLYYFIYDQAPPRTRSLAQAFNLLASGAISNGFTASITTALSQYYPDDLNDGHIEYFYYVSAAGAVVAIPLYIFFASRFQYKDYSKDGDGLLTPQAAGKVVDPTADFHPPPYEAEAGSTGTSQQAVTTLSSGTVGGPSA